MSKILFIFILSTLSMATFAKFNKEQMKEVDFKIFKTEQHLKKSLAEDMKLALGVNELLIDVDIRINKRSLYKDIAGVDKDWNKIKDLQLPSLSLKISKQSDIKEIKKIEIDHIMSHIRDMNIKLFTPYDIVDEKSFKEKLKDIIAANFNYMSKIRLKIELKKIKSYLKDNRKTSIATPELKIDLEKFKPFLPYIWGILGGIIFLVGIFAYVIKNSMGKLKQAVVEKEFGSLQLEQGFQDIASNNRSHDREAENENSQFKSNGRQEDFVHYYQELDRLKKVVGTKFQLVKKMLVLSYKFQEFEQVLVLFEILPVREKENMFGEISIEDEKVFQDFLIEKGELTLKKAERLLVSIKEIASVISLTSINPDYMYSYYLKKALRYLDDQSLITVLKNATNAQFYYLLANTDSAKIAVLFSGNNDLAWPEQYEKIGEKEVKLFVKEIISLIGKQEKEKLVDSRIKTLPYLPEDMETKVLESMNMDQSFKFSNLVVEFEDFVINKIKNMNFDDIKDMIPLFSEVYRQNIINQLPDIIAERLSLVDLDLTTRSYNLKAALFTELISKKQNEKKDEDEETFTAA